MVLMSASMMCGDPLILGQELDKLRQAKIDMLHCDVMDGVFVPNITMGLYMIEAIKKTCDIPTDVHLMVSNPDTFIPPLADIGVEYVTVHVETTTHLHRTIQNIKKLGMKAGVALNPATPVASIKHVIRDINLLLIMTVNPGFAGQAFIDSTVEKIAEAKSMMDDAGLDFLIQVDGNINKQTIPKTVLAGANVLVLGTSSIFKGPLTDYSSVLRDVREYTNQFVPLKKLG